MKKIVFFSLTVGLLASCTFSDSKANEPVAETPIEEQISDFDWLVGTWKRTNEEADKVTVEIWTKSDAYTYAGTSYTLQNKDTIWQEDLTLSPLNKQWTLQVFLKEQNQEVHFELTEMDATSFLAENPENDFPQRIGYKKKDASHLSAYIATGDKQIPYEFEKMD